MKYVREVAKGSFEVQLTRKIYSETELLAFRERLKRHLEQLHAAMEQTTAMLAEVEEACKTIEAKRAKPNQKG